MEYNHSVWDCGYSVLWKVQGCLVNPLGFHCFLTDSFFNYRKPIALLPSHSQVLPWVENCYVSFQYFIHIFETFDGYFKNHNYQAWYYIILWYFNRRLTPGSSQTWNYFQNMRYFLKPGNSGKANIGISWRVFCSIGQKGEVYILDFFFDMIAENWHELYIASLHVSELYRGGSL